MYSIKSQSISTSTQVMRLWKTALDKIVQLTRGGNYQVTIRNTIATTIRTPFSAKVLITLIILNNDLLLEKKLIVGFFPINL